jgi:hypothetical protein
VQNREGTTIAAVGPSADPAFSTQEIRAHVRDRQPLFRTIGSSTSPMVVEALPFVLPPGPLRSPEESVGAGPPGTIEIAEFGGDANVALGSVRRHLLINSTAALVLLFAVALIGSRFRSYVRGKELAHQIEIACSVQRDLLPSATAEVDQFDVAGDYVPVAAATTTMCSPFPAGAWRSSSATSPEREFRQPC